MAATDPRERFNHLAAGLLGRASAESERQVGVPFDPRMADSLDLLDHNEHVIAFENLASNLYEYGVEISGDELAALTELASAWGVQEDRWTYIHELVR